MIELPAVGAVRTGAEQKSIAQIKDLNPFMFRVCYMFCVFNFAIL